MSATRTAYVELHCHSCYSLLDGTAQPDALVERAAALGMDALALTDHNALYGAIGFVRAAHERGVRPILGAELTLEGDAHLTLLAADAMGWANLCLLISAAQANIAKGQPSLPLALLDDHTDGLIALSGCRRGAVLGALARGDRAGAKRAAQWLRERFGPERTAIELQHHLLPGDDRLVAEGVALAEALGLPAVLTNNVHYATRADQPLQDLLVAIRRRATLDGAGALLRPNSEYYLKPQSRLLPLIGAHHHVLENARRVAALCNYAPRYGLQALPAVALPSPHTARSFLAQLCHEALQRRLGEVGEAAQEQLGRELAAIDGARLSNYFLIVWDIARFCRSQGIRCQGRGSAANSLVAYLLGISPIDPLQHRLACERFLPAERPDLPDIDLDIAADRCEEAIQYVYQTYGAAHVAMACTFITFQARSALREVAAALDLPPEAVRDALPLLEAGDTTAHGEGGTAHDTLRLVADLCRRLHGLPRHLGQRSGGLVITQQPIATRVPLEPAATAGRSVAQWDEDALEAAGLVKLNMHGVRMLSALDEAAHIIVETTGESVHLDRLSFDDPAVYDLIASADTIGVFQMQRRAQAQVLLQLRPARFDDLPVAISLLQLAPEQSAIVRSYLRRRQGLEPVTYLHPRLQPALEETLGVILFQEQVLLVARDVGGFMAGQGERLCRALGKRDMAALAPLHTQFVEGARAQGVDEEMAGQVWGQLASVASHTFSMSHAAAIAVVVYQSAWLKRYHPAPFYAALLNNQPVGFWSPAALVGDARRRGVPILPLDIAISGWRCAVEGDGVRLSFGSVAQLGEGLAARILAARNERPFMGLRDCCRRTQLPRPLVEQLIRAGACDAWGKRRALLCELGTLRYDALGPGA